MISKRLHIIILQDTHLQLIAADCGPHSSPRTEDVIPASLIRLQHLKLVVRVRPSLDIHHTQGGTENIALLLQNMARRLHP